MRNSQCDGCGDTFMVIDLHPMVTNDQWCPECTTIMRECVMEQFMNVGPCPAQRSEEV